MTFFAFQHTELITETELRRLLNRVAERGSHCWTVYAADLPALADTLNSRLISSAAHHRNPALLTRQKCAVTCAVIVHRVWAHFRRIRRAIAIF